MGVEIRELDIADTMFFRGVEEGFFRDGVGCFALSLVALFAGLFGVGDARGDARGLGVALPPLLT